MISRSFCWAIMKKMTKKWDLETSNAETKLKIGIYTKNWAKQARLKIFDYGQRSTVNGQRSKSTVRVNSQLLTCADVACVTSQFTKLKISKFYSLSFLFDTYILGGLLLVMILIYVWCQLRNLSVLWYLSRPWHMPNRLGICLSQLSQSNQGSTSTWLTLLLSPVLDASESTNWTLVYKQLDKC